MRCDVCGPRLTGNKMVDALKRTDTTMIRASIHPRGNALGGRGGRRRKPIDIIARTGIETNRRMNTCAVRIPMAAQVRRLINRKEGTISPLRDKVSRCTIHSIHTSITTPHNINNNSNFMTRHPHQHQLICLNNGPWS